MARGPRRGLRRVRASDARRRHGPRGRVRFRRCPSMCFGTRAHGPRPGTSSGGGCSRSCSPTGSARTATRRLTARVPTRMMIVLLLIRRQARCSDDRADQRHAGAPEPRDARRQRRRGRALVDHAPRSRGCRAGERRGPPGACGHRSSLPEPSGALALAGLWADVPNAEIDAFLDVLRAERVIAEVRGSVPINVQSDETFATTGRTSA